jgi:hypothetical protein
LFLPPLVSYRRFCSPLVFPAGRFGLSLHRSERGFLCEDFPLQTPGHGLSFGSAPGDSFLASWSPSSAGIFCPTAQVRSDLISALRPWLWPGVVLVGSSFCDREDNLHDSRNSRASCFFMVGSSDLCSVHSSYQASDFLVAQLDSVLIECR